jgi:hypothetical protein
VILAKRELFISRREGGPLSVPVVIETPVYDRNAWKCSFSIGWPDGERRHHGMGYDAVQALLHALSTIAIHLYASPYHHAGTLYFDEPGRGYGFPLPAGGRDVAIGDDREL